MDKVKSFLRSIGLFNILKDFQLFLFESVYYLKFKHKKNIQINPYGSHIPILISIMNNFNIRSVLETGSGLNSTMIFLEKYNGIEILHSVENDFSWFKKMRNITSSFSNYKLTHTLAIDNYLSVFLSNNLYDLIFIDDSCDYEDRIRTIEICLSKEFDTYIIHDYDYKPYRLKVESMIRFSKEKYYIEIVHSFYPHTAVITKDFSIYQKVKTHQTLYKKNQRIEASNFDFWNKTLSD